MGYLVLPSQIKPYGFVGISSDAPLGSRSVEVTDTRSTLHLARLHFPAQMVNE